MIDCSINHCWHILNTTNKCFVPIHVQNRFGHGSKSKIITQDSFLDLSKIGKRIQCSEEKKIYLGENSCENSCVGYH